MPTASRGAGFAIGGRLLASVAAWRIIINEKRCHKYLVERLECLHSGNQEAKLEAIAVFSGMAMGLVGLLIAVGALALLLWMRRDWKKADSRRLRQLLEENPQLLLIQSNDKETWVQRLGDIWNNEKSI